MTGLNSIDWSKCEKLLQRFPVELGEFISKRFADWSRDSLYTAASRLHDFEDALECAIDINSTDADLIILSMNIIDEVRTIKETYQPAHNTNLSNADWRKALLLNDLVFQKLHDICATYNVRYPSEFSREQILPRLQDSAWWVRRLRAVHVRDVESLAIKAGAVSKKAHLYISEDTLIARAAQKKRNIEMMQDTVLRNTKTGEEMKLADIANAGMSALHVRHAELITRIKGFESLANKYKHASEFITITCPSRMHAVTKEGKINPHYDGTKPDDAQKYLVKHWARVRAKLARDGIRVYGLRVAEPHHDATPHWHVILFYENALNVKYAIRAAMVEHFIHDEGFELLNAAQKKARLKNGVQFVSIDPAKGSAVGYVMKYVTKNLGGKNDLSADESLNEGESTKSLWSRVEAWAACWKIRQFQQIGGHFVGVWRELRRVDESAALTANERLLMLWKTAQRKESDLASFEFYIERMGGLKTPARKSTYAVVVDFVTIRGRYGENVVPKPLGVGERFGSEAVASKRDAWEVVR